MLTALQRSRDVFFFFFLCLFIQIRKAVWLVTVSFESHGERWTNLIFYLVAEIVQNAGLFLIHILSVFLFLLLCTVSLQQQFLNYTVGLIMWQNEQLREDKMRKDSPQRL